MHFKLRTVAVFVVLTMMISVLGTLMATDKWVMQKLGGIPAASEAAAEGEGLSEKEEAKLGAVMDLIEDKYYKDVEREKVINGAIAGMMESLGDPYSVYMEKDTAKHFSESIGGSFTGIGAEVTIENGKVVVISAIKDSPASRAGVMPKDVLLSVNGEKLEGLQLNDAVSKIRGPRGTKAKLEIQRAGVNKPIRLELVRDDIDVETVYASMKTDNIGLIEIRQFSKNTAERFAEELKKLEDQGMKGLVIDVRNDPGGVLPVVLAIAEPFIAQGKTMVQVEDREGTKETTESKGPGRNYPLAVLINEGSASASEILAGALQQSAGAVLVGAKTFGKGTVQVSYDKSLGDGSLVKMTIAKWLTPNGTWVHEKGIEPDIAVAAPEVYKTAKLSRTEPLKKDQIGDDVSSLQHMLNALGYKTDRTDGYFSESTEKAVRQFQQSSSLPVTGVVDNATADAIEKGVVAWIRNPANDVQLNKALGTVREKLKKAS
ncbi:carboxyl-terminal processing protease [Paenibacillus cellulosilyticus]|uniref:Carboxyl-terminal processing protease n=1 Tax=Paenibacillus cellulosilyticus TaxID=375489 RepID=A0A2V2Z882_9BACL|nr:S41 family peptidase [Paenibacillus cellulosilyticus]PWW08301.1 carboxyl-terminal processing protease [Paenibacillus cellulosilyticus]QKS47901.1 S41 family peptidase [Paenibacillus cellulosilyticus]